MKKKIIALTVALLLLVSVFASCTPTKDETTTPAETTPAATTPDNPSNEITLEEIHTVGKDFLALLGEHENVSLSYEYNGSVIRKDYYNKEYYHSSFSIASFGENGNYETFQTENAEYYYLNGTYSLDVTLASDGIIDMKDYFAAVGETPFLEFNATKNENASFVQQDGLMIVTYTYDQEELAEIGGGLVSLVETYTIDITTREIISAKALSAYDDETTSDLYITIARDVEAPERAEEFLKFENATENLRTVTIVSNPGTENEKTESIQVPKGLPIDVSAYWEVEEILALYTDAACTQIFDEDTDPNTDITVYAKWEESIPEVEITLQEVYDAGKNLLALLGDHENVYVCITSEGKVIREEYLSKQYAYSYYSADFMDIGFEYSNFVTDTAAYSYFDGLYALDVTLTPDGIVETSGLLTLMGTSAFISSAVLNDETTIVEEDGFIIVACTADLEDLLLMEEGVVSCVETYTLDAETREMVSIKTVYTYEDGTTEEGVVTITRDVEDPESMKPFLAFAQETEDMRTVTIVSNPGTENEKTESIQVPKGLQVAIGSDWDVEETFSVYEDAACTQPFEEMWDVNSDITIYVKWDEIRYTVTPEEWDAAVVENNFTVERIEGGETVTIQKYTDYALDVDGSVFMFIDDKIYELVEEEDGWFAYDCTYLEFSPSFLLDGCDMADFEYDEIEQAYFYKYWEDYGYTIALRFENGLPVSMTLVDIEDESNVIIRLFTNVGTTVIEIPEDYTIVEDDDPITLSPVTEEVWNSFVGETNFEYGIFISGIVDSEFYSEGHNVKSTGNALVIDDVIYVLEDGKYYVLEETADGWIATETTLPAFCFTSLLEGLHYNDYEFYAETGYYVPKEVAENEPYCELLFDENGVLVAIFIYNDNVSENPEVAGADLSTMIGFYDIGNTVIEVPEYTIVE